MSATWKTSEFGARPDATPTENQEALRAALAAATAAGGGTVILTAGAYDAVPVPSGVSLAGPGPTDGAVRSAVKP